MNVSQLLLSLRQSFSRKTGVLSRTALAGGALALSAGLVSGPVLAEPDLMGEDIDIFLTLAETLSFRQAAERMHLTQTAVTARIQSITGLAST